MEDYVDGFFKTIVNFILSIFKFIIDILFSSQISTIITGFIFMNLLGFAVMYKDKKITKNNEKIKEEKDKVRRIPERTLLLIALCFGSLRYFSWNVQISS